MTWVAVAVVGGAVIGAGASVYSSQKAGEASQEAARVQAASEQESLDYLKETGEMPQFYKEQALGQLAGLQGLEGGEGSQQELIDRAMSSPLYQQLMGGREAGEEAILRSASATGGLRSGNVQSALYGYNAQLQNQALLQSYNQQIRGLSGLAGTPTNEPLIAQGIAGVGQTTAQGITAAGQIQQQGIQQQGEIWSGAVGQLGGIASQRYDPRMPSQPGAVQQIPNMSVPALNYSDRRLKKNLKKVGKVKGFNWYEWDWNIVANKMGLSGSSSGVLADEIHDTNPECISIKNLFMVVDYTQLLGGQNG